MSGFFVAVKRLVRRWVFRGIRCPSCGGKDFDPLDHGDYLEWFCQCGESFTFADNGSVIWM